MKTRIYELDRRDFSALQPPALEARSTAMGSTRREFLRHATHAAGVLLLGCGAEDAATGGLESLFAGGERVGDAEFVEEDVPPPGTVLGQGWDGRLYFDHSQLTEDSLVVPSELFYIRTLYPDRLRAPDPWVLRIRGLAPGVDLRLADLRELERDMGVHLLECSGNRGAGFGLISAARWGGIPLSELLERARPMPAATQLRVSGFDEHSVPSAGGHSTPGASWVFGLEQLLQAQAFLATTMNDELLPEHHGQPVRLFVPGWYGCVAIKWVDELVFVGDDEPPTSQMIEFASRTHQPDPVPELARGFRAATLDHAAMPIRVERWVLATGETAYRIVGILWGGSGAVSGLEIQLGEGPWEPVLLSDDVVSTHTWALWTYAWRAPGAGVYSIRMRFSNPTLPQRRLESDWYLRRVRIDS